ncbi:MAG: flagellar hook-length control protein FliK [Pseudomonadota bacterium]
MISIALALSSPASAPLVARGRDAHAPVEDATGRPSEAGSERAALSFGERLGEAEKSIGGPLPRRAAETTALQDKDPANVNTAAPLADEEGTASTGDRPLRTLKVSSKGQGEEPAKALPSSPETSIHAPEDAKATLPAAAEEEASLEIAPENALAPPAPPAAAIVPQPASDTAAHGAAPEVAPEATSLAAVADAPAQRSTPAMQGTNDVETQTSPEPPVAQTGQKTAEPIDIDTRALTGGSEPTPPLAPLAPLTGPAPTTPATQAPALPLPLNMAAPAWPHALADYISQPRLGDNDTLTLTLTPERMGALQIRISVEEGRTDIQIVAETAEAMATLRDSQNRLADAFSRAGLELGSQSLQLDHPEGQGGAQGGGAQGWEAAHHSGAEEGGQYATNDGETGPLAPASSSPDRARLAPGQSIDLLA